ncbi:cysteine desulfurase [Pseudomonas sp. CVAP|uniref:cysteine desulfurase n=1 Tax=Pseudomonas sp. CVAP\|nr:cysteine desulfurase [Pseudomonas sp. CVAP\
METLELESMAPLVARDDFIFLQGNRRVYLDNSSTSLKPMKVINALTGYYRDAGSNVGRSNHRYAEAATGLYEATRLELAYFLNCAADEVIFTANCTDAINLAANTLSLIRGDHVVISPLEHHSNLLPWLAFCDVSVVRLDEEGLVDLDYLDSLLASKPAKLIAVCHASNITGNIQPVADICKIAKRRGTLTLIDAAQTVGHIPVDVESIGCDFLAFSGHKMLGPSGVGVLFACKEVQSSMQCNRQGGGMVNKVDGNEVTFQTGPARFEAGTPNIEGVIGLGAALGYLSDIGYKRIQQHDHSLETYFSKKIQSVPHLYFPFATSKHHLPIFTFVPEGGIDVGFISRILSDKYDIAISSGFQCNQPLYRDRGLNGGLRVSMHLYNTQDDIDRFVNAMTDLQKLMA